MVDKSVTKRVVVKEILSSRYQTTDRPVRWVERIAGIDKILTTSGQEVTLYSNGGQSTPETGWELLLTGPTTENGVTATSWTLYGIKPS